MDTNTHMVQISSGDNLNVTYLQVVRNKGAVGTNGMTVEELPYIFWKTAKTLRSRCGQRNIDRS